MFWEPQNASLHHKGGGILLPTVAESECTNCKQYIEWQVYKKRGEEEDSPRYNRNQEIVKELVRIIVQYYKTERNVSFYAEKLHLSPQHLSTTVKKVTGKTVTDILSSFIIRDAQAKLRSTDMTVQEIAYSLNFSDNSFFGKYFKRYTGMSPKQYRNM